MLKLILCALLLVLPAACGDGGGGYDDAPPQDDDPAWLEIKPVVDANCGGCHNGSTHPLRLDSKQAFRSAKVRTRITNGSMPPAPRKLAEADKAALLAYLEGE